MKENKIKSRIWKQLQQEGKHPSLRLHRLLSVGKTKGPPLKWGKASRFRSCTSRRRCVCWWHWRPSWSCTASRIWRAWARKTRETPCRRDGEGTCRRPRCPLGSPGSSPPSPLEWNWGTPWSTESPDWSCCSVGAAVCLWRARNAPRKAEWPGRTPRSVCGLWCRWGSSTGGRRMA